MRDETHVDTVSCVNCENRLPLNEAVIDEYKENYFCDGQCFDEWASDYLEILLHFYKDLNVYLN